MGRIRMLTTPIAIAAVAAACTPVQQAAIDAVLVQGEAGIKAAHDREALALKQAPCAMSVGGYVRALTAAERDAVLALCGGEQGLTFDDLADVGRAIDLLQRESGAGFGDVARE
ncbi:MAG: hypothetical protein ACREH3_04900 [Geminicoccales bacterium]